MSSQQTKLVSIGNLEQVIMADRLIGLGRSVGSSNIDDFNLAMLLISLRNVKKTMVYSTVDAEAEREPSVGLVCLAQTVDRLLASSAAHFNELEVLESGASMSAGALSRLGIINVGILAVKSGQEERVRESSLASPNELWSSDNVYRQLEHLRNRSVGVSKRLALTYRDAFFLRAAAILLSQGKRLFWTGDLSPAKQDMWNRGYTDCFAVVSAQDDKIELFQNFPHLTSVPLGNPSGFFVTEVKSLSVPLQEYVPEVICAMYATAQCIERTTVRGALTNGFTWIFLLINVNQADSDGRATYMQSTPITLEFAEGAKKVVESTADTIAGILSFWMDHGLSELGEDDWFEVQA